MFDFLFDYLAKCFVEVVVIMFGLNEGDNCWGGQSFYVSSMCRFRFKFYQAVVQRCRIICFKFMYWLRLGAVVPVWFCMSSILQYQSQFGTNWLNRCIVPFLRHSADASFFVRQVELAPGRFVLPSGHARTQPARAFPAQTVKPGWTLLSTGSIVVLVLQALIQRFLPGFFMKQGSEEGWAKAEKERARPCTAARGGIHQGLHQFTSRSSFEHPFLLGGQWFPRHWEINHAEQSPEWACEEWQKGASSWYFCSSWWGLEAERGATPSVTSRRFAPILPVKCQIFAGTGEWDVQAPNRQCRRGIPATHNRKPRRQI